jgi:hypothetical protein
MKTLDVPLFCGGCRPEYRCAQCRRRNSIVPNNFVVTIIVVLFVASGSFLTGFILGSHSYDQYVHLNKMEKGNPIPH